MELVWTLDRAYGRSRLGIVTAWRALAGNATVLLESGPAVAQAVVLYEAGPADFADSLLVCKAGRLGCEAVRTFDKRMRSLPGVKLL